MGAAPIWEEPSPSALPPGAVIDRYEVLGLLGVGGMASVYRARHRQLDSIVALKVLVLDRPSMRRRVEREGRVQASIRHPNLVAVTDSVSTLGGTPVLVLEYVCGPSLDRLLAARRLSLPEVDMVVRGILRGVAHAHGHGVIHRDLKPANVLLARGEGELSPKLTDFGIVKLVSPGDDPNRTQTGQLMGTPAYMAPEQFSDASQVDVRADIWSLGVLMYELCTGRLPFGGDEPQNVFGRLVSGLYPSPSLLVPELPERMAQAIDSALRHDPALRAPSVEALLSLWCGGIEDDAVAQSFGTSQIWDTATLGMAAALSPTPEPVTPTVLAPTLVGRSRARDIPTVRPAWPLPPPPRSQAESRRLMEVLAVLSALLLTATVASAFGALVALSVGPL